MQNLIETAMHKAHSADERAEAHMEFADMMHEAGFHALAKSRKAASVSESKTADFFRCAAHAMQSPPPALRDIVESIQARRGVTLAK